MRLPAPSAWQSLSGLAALLLAYLLAVGSGMDIDVEHDLEHWWVALIAAIMALGGAFLLWLSLRKPSPGRM